MVHHWGFSNTLAASVGGQDGTWSGAAGDFAAGRIGRAISLGSAKNECVDVGSDSSLSLLGDKTLSCWVNLNAALADQPGLISLGTSWNHIASLYLRNESGKQIAAAFNKSGSGSVYTVRGGNIGHGAWHMVTATYVASTNARAIYLDGADIASPTLGSGSGGTTAAGKIGRVVGISGEYLDGLIDDVRVYDRALSSADVGSLYEMPGRVHGAYRPIFRGGIAA